MTTFYGPLVRVRHSMLDAMYYVEVKSESGGWTPISTYSEMSNGFARTQAHERAQAVRAQAVRAQLLERENVLPPTA